MDEVKKTDERQHPIEHRENFIAALTETGKAIRAHIGEIKRTDRAYLFQSPSEVSDVLSVSRKNTLSKLL